MSVLHRACYFGDITTVNEVLSKDSDHVLALLQAQGLIFDPHPAQVRSGESFLRHGTPAQLAVLGSNFKCANLVQAALLCSHMRLAPYWRRSVELQHNRDVTLDDRLRVLLVVFAKRHLWHLQTICSIPRSAKLDVLYTLLAACILGDYKIVQALIRDPQRADRWRTIREELQKYFFDRHDTYCDVRHLAVCAAALSGDQKCLQALLHRKVGRVLPQTLNKAWVCVLKFVWPWNLPQILPCLKFIKATNVSFPLGTNHRLFPSLVTNASEWMAWRPHLQTDLVALHKSIPSPQEFIDLLDSVIEFGFNMVAWNKKNVDVSKMMEATLAASTQVREARDLQSLERLLVLLLSHRDTVPVLGCLGCHGLLRRLRRQAGVVRTACQYMVVCHKWRVCLNEDCSCPMCHPVINFVCGLDPANSSPQTDEALEMMCYYLSSKDRSWLQDVIRKGIEAWTLCRKHKNVSMVHHPMFFKLGDEEIPRVLQVVLEIPITPTLLQASLIAVLESLDGDASRLDTLKVPFGLRRHFFLHDFLQMPTYRDI